MNQLGRMAPQSFNDLLALLMAVGLIPALWVIHIVVEPFPELVLGATLIIEQTIVLYYFRRRPGNGSEAGG